MDTKFVTSDDRRLYTAGVSHILQPLLHPCPDVVWHYTTGEALISIIQSGQLFATQTSCLNDSTEFQYASDLFRSAFAEKVSKVPENTDASWFLSHVQQLLAVDTAETNHWFVTCFSARRDDLSQWRAYSNGENGFALGFRTAELIERGKLNKNDFLPVIYERSKQEEIASALANFTLDLFLRGLKAGRAPREEWANDFLLAWADYVTHFAPMAKHHAFAAEEEWRIAHILDPSDTGRMTYRQGKTLLARHLPLRYPPIDDQDSKLLPVCEIMVGPSRHKRVSKIGVGDLLRTHGYIENSVAITLSEVPFQGT